MGKLQMCRICLVENVRMYVVVNRNLHELYEKLTDIPFVTEDRRPILACFFCCTKLKQCCRLLRQCLEAEEQFAQMMNEDYEPNPSTNQDRIEFYSGFIKSPIEHINVVDECQTESITIKEELPAVCEELDDIIEPKEEHQSNELEPDNFNNSCLDVADIPPHCSESDLGYDVPIIEFKTEVEEEVSLDNSCLDVADLPAHYSESDIGYDVPLIEFKTEVEEEAFKEKRTAGETEKIISNVDKNPIAAVLMEMSKAFDRVNHKILLDRRSDEKKKLKNFTDGGIRKRQGDDEGKIDEYKKRRSVQNRMKCRRYRENLKKRDAIVSSQTTITVEEEEMIKRRKEYNRQKTQRYRDKKRATELINLHTKRQGDEGAKFCDDGRNQHEIDEIKKRMSIQNKIKCRRYRENKKKRDAIISSQTKHRTITVEEEENIKHRKEWNKQNTQRYRDKERATKLINLHTDQSSKTVMEGP